MQNHTLINVATHYDATLRELRAQAVALRALTDNAYAQAQADTLEDVIRHLSLLGKALEGVPTWQDINDSLRAGAV